MPRPQPLLLSAFLVAAPGQALAQTIFHDLRARDGLTIISRIPATGPGLPVPPAPPAPPADIGDWQLMSVPPNVFIRAISMGSRNVGFAAAELGIVLRSTDGGDSWQTILNQGFPFYWYGVHAFNEQTVIITGFNNSTGDGIFRWSDDGGNSWGPVQSLASTAPLRWAYFVNFADQNRGIIQSAIGIHYTTTGGRTPAEWHFVQPGPNWFQGPFTFLQDGRAWMTGYDNFRSNDGGQTWTSLPRAHPLFDGPHHFRFSDYGYIGGGSISPSVAGWLYSSINGGSSWSAQPVLQTPYPIRAIKQQFYSAQFYSRLTGWAVGGNSFSGVGGIWATDDWGQSWHLEQNTGVELLDIQAVATTLCFANLFAAGASHVWRRRIDICCYANCDFSNIPPTLNVADFGCFLSKFAAGDPYANCDESTTPPILNVADFSCFLQKFAAGCP
jgi:photosystem II stability/assembly factor-like uncharacterized protein